MTSRPKGAGRTREGSAEQVENYVGIPLTDGQRRKLQQLADKVPTESLEDLAARALEAGVDRLLKDDDEPTHTESSHGELMLQDQVALLARAFENRGKTTVPSSITVPLNSMNRFVISQVMKARPEMTLDETGKTLVTRGIAQLMKESGIGKNKPRASKSSPKGT